MSRRNWKRVRPNSAIEALRLCKEYAQDKKNLSVERIADRMGATHDSLYKWLGTGRMPYNMIQPYELACGCHFASEWLAASVGKLVIPMPTGRTATPPDLVQLNSGFSASLQLLSNFYANPQDADPAEVLAALREHMTQVAYHHANVAQHATPELDFEA